MHRTQYFEIFAIFLIVSLFVVAGYFSNQYEDVLRASLADYGVLGMALYVAGGALVIVTAPLSFFPLLPVAVALWGSFVSALLSILAWTIGAVAAFYLARRFGKPLVRRMIGERRMRKIERLIPPEYLFIATVLLRIVLPVDIVSYALGLFTKMRFGPYLLATVIGITPFAFVFSYLADASLTEQVTLFAIAAAVLFAGYPFVTRWYSALFLSHNK